MKGRGEPYSSRIAIAKNEVVLKKEWGQSGNLRSMEKIGTDTMRDVSGSQQVMSKVISCK